MSRWLAFVPPPPAPTGVAAALLAAGVPTLAAPADPTDARALATALLDVASELEHALMIEYLYAAYSVIDAGASQQIATIAAQEMGHLATVQNLRLALGLPAYLGRQDLDPHPDHDPFVFKLEPLSLDSLAKYTAAEAPTADQVPPDLKATVAEIEQRAAAAAGAKVNQVGAIYATLYWLFLPTDASGSSPWPDFPEQTFRDRCIPQLQPLQPASVSFQAEPVEWRSSSRNLHVSVCDSGAAALQALFHIAAQGEGLTAAPDSHFSRFVKLYVQARDQGGIAVQPVPIDANLGNGPATGLITDPTSVAVAKVLDALYGALQIEILTSLAIDRTGPQAAARRALVTHLVTEVMVGAIGPLARRLAMTLPQVAGQTQADPRRAGAPFSPCSVTGGTLPELLQDWREAIDALESCNNEALAQPDPTGLLAGDLATVGDIIDTKRELLTQVGGS